MPVLESLHLGSHSRWDFGLEAIRDDLAAAREAVMRAERKLSALTGLA
jgi:hypothetical protein